MVEFKPIADKEPALVHSPLLKAVLLTLGYIEEHGPIGLTPLKALKRYFVEWAAREFAWPHYTAAELFEMNKFLNEQDFMPLLVLHDVLIATKLARHYKGTLQITKLGRELSRQPSELWALLARHLLFHHDHSQYVRSDERPLGNWDVFLNVINVETDMGASEGRLCSVLYGGDEAGFRRHSYKIAFAFYAHVLRPLCWVGLLFEHRTGCGFEQREIFTKTPLWVAALKLDTDQHLTQQTQH
jgi:hypothetical protein